MKSCLLVIDAQESFRHRPYFTPRDLGAYVAAQNALIDGCQAQGIAVARIFHVDGPATASNPFALESGHVRALAELQPFEPAATFHKHRHSALVGSGLDVWLIQHGINRLIVSGIRTEQCCETTTRHASDLGFKVDFVTDATLTFDMRLPNGAPLSSAGITTGIDLALHLVAQICGETLAARVAQTMVVALRRGPQDPELSPFLAYRNHLHPALHRVQDALASQPAHAWTLPAMAEIACTSPRHLNRLFVDHAGIAPLQYLRRIRLAVAQAALHSGHNVTQAAAVSGFGSDTLRRAWHQLHGAGTPSGRI